ncbi:N-terminal binuclear Zn cluster-containing/DNA binding domain-containing protein [Apiospora aurea]|uniref:N-terminal binuclear Zn cluster-containing/DNA binding domain-containing protein n=1 Tax=Apiospora aurea TaxID=335848 RepID=A0ABR1Q6H2_9PEZI
MGVSRHAIPVGTERKGGKRCVYTISSSTPVRPHGGKPSSQPRQGADRPRQPSSPSPSSVQLNEMQSPSPSASLRNNILNRRATGGHGYLGATSYSAVFQETRDNLNLLGATPRTQANSRELFGQEEPDILTPSIRELCFTVLRLLPQPNKVVFQKKTYVSVYHSFMRGIAEHILKSLYETWGEHLNSGADDDTKLEDMAKAVCVNTMEPFSYTIRGSEEWLSQFSGPNLRWEALGVLFDLLDTEAKCVKRRFVSETQHEYLEYQRRIAAAGLRTLGLCIQLSREFTEGNILLIHLYHRRGILESKTSGDASLPTWQCHAACMSLLTFHGFHDEPSTHSYQYNPSYRPSLAVECRRRMLAVCFCSDNNMVTFTGRPPLLGTSYISTPLPLDVSDDVLFSDEQILARVASETLDERGWNTSGHFHPATLIRARVILSHIRAEIAQLALGKDPFPFERIGQIRAKQTQAVSEFPKTAVFQLHELRAADMDITSFYQRLLVRLEILMNEFLLDRLQYRHFQADSSDLLVTAYEMVVLTLTVWTHMDLLTEKRDFDWVLMGYGAPAGGVLCMELLNPTLQGAHPKNAEISRSAIIQKLSLLVGFFEWVSPSAPNAALCENAMVTIKHVLDATLNIDPAAAAAAAGQAGMANIDWNFSTQVDYNFDLLDTFDWLRADA